MRDAALLAWLAVEGPTPRHRLATLLWPDSTVAQARTTLRQRLFQLKATLGRNVAVGVSTLQLTGGVSHDLHAATGLLGSLVMSDAPEIDAWLEQERERRRRLEIETLRVQACDLEASGNADAALPLAEAALRLQPLAEEAHRRVIRLHYLAGDRAAALVAFDHCEQVLKHELGACPSSETLALLRTVEQAQVPRSMSARRALPAAVLRPPRMVGREMERLAVLRAWDAGHVAAIVGEAGMGKSRLLLETIEPLPGVVRCAGRPGDAGVPFATLARLLRAVHERSAVLTMDAAVRHQLARVLPELGDGVPPPLETHRLQLQLALVNLLRSSPGLEGLVIDDLHFADAPSVDVLQALIVETPSLRWGLAYRSAEAGSPVLALQTALGEAAMLATVAVSPLTESALAELVDQLDIGLSGTSIAAQLLQRTGGNPLFVLETLKQAWIEQCIDRVAIGAALPRPMSVGQLIRRRIALLSPSALAFARVASIAGVDFTLALAETVLTVPAMQFANDLVELENAQVLKGLQFAHDLVFDAVRDGVPAAVATHFHAKVAGWLEAHGGAPARVAAHWIDADRPELALSWLRRATSEAIAAMCTREALGFMDQLAEIEEALGRRESAFATRREAIDSLVGLACHGADSEARCDHLDRLARTDAQRCRAWLTRAKSLSHRNEGALAESLARRAFEAAPATGDAVLVQECQVALFQALRVSERDDEALALADHCLPWIDAVSDLDLRFQFHTDLAVLHDTVGRLSSGLHHHTQALALAERLGDPANRIVIIGNQSNNRSQAGQLRLAVTMRRQALLLASEAEVVLPADAVVYTNLAQTLTLLGEYAEALRCCDRAEAGLDETKHSAVPLAWAHRGMCWLHLGQRHRALQVVQNIAAFPDAILQARIRGHLLAYALSAEAGVPEHVHLAAADALLPEQAYATLRAAVNIQRALSAAPAAALAALVAVREQARQQEQQGIVLETHIRAAQVARELDPALACRHADMALSLAESFDTVLSYRGELWLQCALTFFAAGDDTRGSSVLDRGLDWVRTIARVHVPELFRESFLDRNPVNVWLAQLGSRTVMPP